MYTPTSSEASQVNKANAVLYPKAASLPSGRLVASFERSIGDPVGQTLPIYKSDDFGTSWQKLTDLASPAAMTKGTSRASAFAKYTSNWTNPYLYTLPQDVGSLKKGTLLLASVVSGDDPYYKEQKAADPNWTPTQDGDRKDIAIALYADTSGAGSSWQFLNIIATGGWEGSYGHLHSKENTYAQNDPVWEPYLMVYNGQLVAYYSDENEYSSYDTATGLLTPDPNNATATDPVSQILVHKTWSGSSTSDWSAAVVDVADKVAGSSSSGRPGMTTVVPTTDGKWLMTFEFGGARVSDNPLRFWDKPNVTLKNAAGQSIHNAGSPVLITVPRANGKWEILFNNQDSANGGDLWVNTTGTSDGTWTRMRTSVAAGYSRNLTYVPQTGRVVILRGTFGNANSIEYGEVDLGQSIGQYYQLVNKKTGDVLGTKNTAQDSDFSGARVDTEAAGSASDGDTQWWHLTSKPSGMTTLLNGSGGRALGIWQDSTTAGAELALWNDDNNRDKLWNLINNADGTITLQSSSNSSLYATANARGSAVTTATANSDGSQSWTLVARDGAAARQNTASGRCLDVPNGANGAQVQLYDCVGNNNQAITPSRSGELRVAGGCLAAEADRTAPGTRVILWSCNGKASQQWDLRVDGTIANQLSGLVLDAAGTANGSQVSLNTPNGSSRQVFTRR
ncbi:RICIN domain-containing protein [Curtobacterium sp. B18]|uniref:RICIN domain-containing protein n=1 Tax=Curtobacterium sp. B18 TaxID=95614 RepID=UPI001C9E068D|nr:ricin-type beta-trefoil lectin domain protein [Curtobacterium sp. B18]